MPISSEIEKLERRWNENPSGLMFAPLAEAYRKAGDLQRALEILEVGLSVHQDYVPALIVRGRCHLDLADLAAAELALEQVLARDPANPIALRAMAEVCERGGRIGEAIERFELLVELDRNHADARANLDRLRAGPSTSLAVAESSAPVSGLPPASDVAAAEPGDAPDASERVAAAEVVDLADASPVPDLVIGDLTVDPLGGPEEAGVAAELRMPWEPIPLPPLEDPVPAEEPREPSPLSEESGPPIAEVASPAAAVTDADPVPVGTLPAFVGNASVMDLLLPAPSDPAPLPLSPESPAANEVPAEDPAVRSEATGDDGAPAADGAVTEGAVSQAAEAPVDAGEPEVPSGLMVAGEEEGEVASETPAGESPVMDQSVPPESPEGADIPWPAVSTAEGEEEVESSAPAEPAAGAGAEDAPVLIVTESMAELFLKQGHRELALAVYRQLLERSPEDPSLRDAIAGLEQDVEARGGEARGASERPVRAARETGGTPVEGMLRAVLASPPPSGTSTVLPPAIEQVIAGQPTRPGLEPLTLGQVFGDEPSVPPPALENEPAGIPEPSFDEFFGAPATGAAADAASGTGTRTPEGDDMRQFTEWLRGLKR